jgi:hypothetical protein
MTDVTIRVERVDHETSPRFVYRCGWTSDGIAWDPQGCSHATPKEAALHVDELKGKRPTDWAEEAIHE